LANEGHSGEGVWAEPAKRLLDFIGRVTEGKITNVGLSEALRAAWLLQRLMTFVTPPGPELPREYLVAGANALKGFTSTEVAEKAYLAAGEHPKGRPVVRRYVAAAALEYKKARPRVGRLALAQQFCPCSKTRHDNHCAKRLRRDIQRLNVLIRQILAGYPA
jgi:hypothetical protein